MIVKLYRVGKDGKTSFEFDSYEYISKDAKYSELIKKLEEKYH